MKIYKRITVLFAMMICVPLFGQQITDLRLNEILLKNDSNYTDEYGRHVPWIEIYNTSFNSVNVGGCFLTDDTAGLSLGKGNPYWYRIPTGDPKTLIPMRSFAIFFLDADPLYGTFHTNFNPQTSKNNYVALINSNGKSLIDILYFPLALRHESRSFGCFTDGIETVKDDNGKWISNVGQLDNITPGSANKPLEGATKAEKLKKDDPYGFGLAIIAMAVVFSALILIYFMLKIFGRVSMRKTKKQKAMTGNKTASTVPDAAADASDEGPTGEEITAIAMALHLHFNSLHDEESEVITIETTSAKYSPWAQKELIMKKVQRKF